ncbi:hypothetical protein K4F52_010360 [Lecanicillium sp. MT-2017a]|nr:hypothetical protein K4F52_010360 [Lecanicillium sp. MT-2017a]
MVDVYALFLVIFYALRFIPLPDRAAWWDTAKAKNGNVQEITTRTKFRRTVVKAVDAARLSGKVGVVLSMGLEKSPEKRWTAQELLRTMIEYGFTIGDSSVQKPWLEDKSVRY